jgi:hypothetical protein
MLQKLNEQQLMDKCASHVKVPNLVWALSRDPFDDMFWFVVKMVCDNYGDCHLSNENLAILSKMSVGKAVDCRNYQISIGLLAGELKKGERDLDRFKLPTWRLWIPDFNDRNIEWCDAHPTVASQLEWIKTRDLTKYGIQSKPQ